MMDGDGNRDGTLEEVRTRMNGGRSRGPAAAAGPWAEWSLASSPELELDGDHGYPRMRTRV
jgi:hypothetical protein